MSNFKRITKHPNTGKFEEAEWLDDYFGKHKYGVKFPSDGNIYRDSDHAWMFEDLEKTYALLQKAPRHDSPEFIDYLRDNNKVVHESHNWIIIENCKYHTPEKPWLTAFYKHVGEHSALLDLSWLGFLFWDWEWLKKAKSKQTVRRFHIHLIQK
jgi:hypothetical protein